MLILLLPPQHVYLFLDSSANDLAAFENLSTCHWANSNFYNFFMVFFIKIKGIGGILKTKCCDTEHDKTFRQDKNINHIKVLITAGPLMLSNLFSTVKVVQIENFNPDVFFARCFYPVIFIICSGQREVSLIFR